MMWLSDEEKECLTNPAGRGYSGKVQHSSSGRKCEYWSKTPNSLGISLQDINIDDAQNYCMYMPGLSWSQPSCLVSSPSSKMRIEPCDIEYCGGKYVTVQFKLWTKKSTKMFLSCLLKTRPILIKIRHSLSWIYMLQNNFNLPYLNVVSTLSCKTKIHIL